MDGYIKNKKMAITVARKTIVAKYTTTWFILIFIPIFVFGIMTHQAPEEWISIEVEYSYISQSHIGLSRGRRTVLNAKDGERYVLNPKYVDVEELRKALIPGQKYSLVYSRLPIGEMVIEALSDQDTVYQDIEESYLHWRQEHRHLIHSILVIVGIEFVALVLVDRLWCKPEHDKIRKLKADIERRTLRKKRAC